MAVVRLIAYRIIPVVLIVAATGILLFG